MGLNAAIEKCLLQDDLNAANQAVIEAHGKVHIYEEKTEWLESVAFDLRHKLASVLSLRPEELHQNGVH